MGLFMSPVDGMLDEIVFCGKQHDRLTFSIFKSLLDNRIVDVGMNLQLLEGVLHAGKAMLVSVLILWTGLGRLQACNTGSLGFNLANLFLAVGGQNLSCFLETLVRELFKGNV